MSVDKKTYLAEYYQKNKEKIKERSRQWLSAHKDDPEYKSRKSERGRLWRARNPEYGTTYWRKRYASDPAFREKCVESAYKFRYERRKRIEGHFSASEWKLIQWLNGNACAICKRADVKLCKDHIIPVSRGGKNVFANIQPLCRPCNSWKGARLIEPPPLYVRDMKPRYVA